MSLCKFSLRKYKRLVETPAGDIHHKNQSYTKWFKHQCGKLRKSDSNWKERESDLLRDLVIIDELEPQIGVEYDAAAVDVIPMESNFDGIGFLKSLSEMVDSFRKFSGINMDDSLLREIEGLGALFVALHGASSMSSIAATIFLYMRSHFKKSVTAEVVDYVNEIFGGMKTQSGNTAPQWLSFLRSIRDDWSICKGNKLFSNLSKMLGLFVVMGCCEASKVTFSIKDYKVIEPDLNLVHADSLDIVDALFSTVSFFVETLYACWANGSIKPLFVGVNFSAEMDEEFANILGWWELVKNGNLERVTREMGQEIQPSEFDRRLEALTVKLRNMLVSLKGFEKKIISDKYHKLLHIKNDYVTIRISSGIRKSPFAIELFGPSSQGKSTFGDQIVDALLASIDAPLGKDYRANYNPSDEFMSNWTTDKLVMTFDDVANEKSKFVSRPPTRAIIDVCNNEPFYAVKAELEAKGKCFVEPLIVLLTTNVKHLDSWVYSNCPYSVQRRMNFVITVTAKKEFQFVHNGATQGIDPSKVRLHHTKDGVFSPPAFDDIWELTVEKAVQPKELGEVASYAPVSWKGKVLSKVGMRLVMQFLIAEFAVHNANQENLIACMKAREGLICKCSFPGCRNMKGYCDDHDFTPHWGEEIAEQVDPTMSRLGAHLERGIAGANSSTEKAVTFGMLAGARYFCKHWNWIKMVPAPVVHSPLFGSIMLGVNFETLRRNYIRNTVLVWSGVSIATLASWYAVPRSIRSRELTAGICCSGSFFGAMAQKFMCKYVRLKYLQNLIKRNTIGDTWKSFRDDKMSGVLMACGFLGTAYAMSKVYRAYRKLHITTQGSLEPVTKEDVLQRDSEQNPWVSVALRPLPISQEVGACTTNDVLCDRILPNLVYGSAEVGKETYMVNCLFLNTGVFIIPSHYFVQDELSITFRKSNPESSGGKFVTRISRSQCVLLRDDSDHVSDLLLCFSSTGGSFRDLVKHLPLADMPTHPANLLWRKKDGSLTKAKAMLNPSEVKTSGEDGKKFNFIGGYYDNLSINTFEGLCGGVWVSDTKGCVISGVHLGGIAGTPRGCYFSLTQASVKLAIEELRKKEGVLLTGSAENFKTQVLGQKLIEGVDLHKKSALNYMPPNSQIAFHGRCSGMATTINSVRVTPISEHVMDVCGIPNVWGAPKLKPEWFAWQAALANMSEPATPFPPSLLAIAILDYKSSLIDLFKTDLWNDICPLTDIQNFNGIPGVKFIDAIKWFTALGHPLKGPKSSRIVFLVPDETYPEPKMLDGEIMSHIVEVEDLYDKGERAFEIAKAQKKIETMLLEKAKCRIYFVGSIAMTFLIRKRFLPIMRVLQMNPLTSECAVGINAHSGEWAQLDRHMSRFGTDRMIGGDYKKYDQKLPSQLVLAAFRICIDCAKVCPGYSERDIRIMENMVGDIAFSLIAFNGDLIGLTEGTHISGNSMTVIVNGIAGALNMRCAYYERFGQTMGPFRENVSLMTYGDDNCGSVKEDVPFDNVVVANFLAKYGQVYTMPDKSLEMKPFVEGDVEFLKRKSVFHEALGLKIGALDENSIFKSLHCYLRERKSPLTPEQACAINIDGAVREWFNHGPEVYEKRRSEMQEVAKRASLDHMCRNLSKTYDDVVLEWMEKYNFKTTPSAWAPDVWILESGSVSDRPYEEDGEVLGMT